MRLKNPNGLCNDQIRTGFIIVMRYIIFAIIVIVVTGFVPYRHPTVRKIPRKKYADIITAACFYHGMLRHEDTIQRMVDVESSRNPNAISDKGARGLMQIMPAVVKDFNREFEIGVHVDDLFDPATNALIGVWYFKLCIDKFGDTRRALSAYNAGHSHPGYMAGYVRKIMGE